MKVWNHDLGEQGGGVVQVINADFDRRFDIGEGAGKDAIGLATKTVGKLEFNQIHLGPLEPAVGGAQGRGDCGGFDDSERFAGDPATHPAQVAHDLGVGGREVDFVDQCIAGKGKPGGKGLLDAGHITPDEHQVFARVDGARVGDLDRGTLDHGVAGTHPDGDGVELDEGDGRLHQTILSPPATVIRLSREKLRGRVRPSPVGLAIENEV